jgi:hypothetical protein
MIGFIFILPAVAICMEFFRWKLLIAFLILFGINLFLQNTLVSSIIENLFLILIGELLLFIVVYDAVVSNLLAEIYKHLTVAKDYAMQGFWALLYSQYHERGTHENWLEQCEGVIARLRLLDEPASNQKADILTQLKNLMSQEEQAADHPGLVNKRYSITYQGKSYQTSFSEVAACRREVGAELSLEKSWGSSFLTFGLFHVPTSSERLLTNFRQDAQNDCAEPMVVQA